MRSSANPDLIATISAGSRCSAFYEHGDAASDAATCFDASVSDYHTPNGSCLVFPSKPVKRRTNRIGVQHWVPREFYDATGIG